jgi:hypothetical protein
MRAEKPGIGLQRFRKYSSSFRSETAGFVAEKRRRFPPFSAVAERRASEAVFVRRFWWDVSAGAVDLPVSLSGPAKRGEELSSRCSSAEARSRLRLIGSNDTFRVVDFCFDTVFFHVDVFFLPADVFFLQVDVFVRHIDVFFLHMDVFVRHVDVSFLHVNVFVRHVDVSFLHMDVFVRHVDVFVLHVNVFFL